MSQRGKSIVVEKNMLKHYYWIHATHHFCHHAYIVFLGKCGLGNKCKNQHLDVRDGHFCQNCKIKLHGRVMRITFCIVDCAITTTTNRKKINCVALDVPNRLKSQNDPPGILIGTMELTFKRICSVGFAVHGEPWM